MTKIKSNGFTLIELIMVIVISGIVIGGASSLLLYGVKEYKIGKESINSNWQANFVIERMKRDLHDVSSVIAASKNYLKVKDINGLVIEYKVEKDRLIYVKCTLKDNQLVCRENVLADNVKGITFSYYADANKEEIKIVNEKNIGTIHYVKIYLDIAYENALSSLSTAVTLWNVK